MNDIWKDRNFKPMLLSEYDKPFNSKDYLFELKFDGIRAILFVSKNELYIQSRNKVDITYFFPELSSIKALVNKNVIFDGEIVSFEDGKLSFSEVQKRIHVKDKIKIKNLSLEKPVMFVVFDILYEGKDITRLPLIERKKCLDKYSESDYFVKSKVIEEDGIKFFESVKVKGLEGIVAKTKMGLYHINKRTDDFIKIKNKKEQVFLIGGYEKKKSGILSLAIGEYVDGKFYFLGKVIIRGNSSIYNSVIKSKKSKNYFCDFNEDIIYIKPVIKCEVEYLERTKNNRLRHPIFRDRKEY